MNRDKGLDLTLKIVLCICLAAVSYFGLGKIFSNPETFSGIFQSIDNKVQSVLKLTASSTAVSAGITALPNDIATPIAGKLADFSEYGILILCVLFAEKYLLTILGSGVFHFILPAVFVLYSLTFFRNFEGFKPTLQKIAAVSIALFIVIPLSIHVSDKIYETFQDSIDSTVSAAEDLASDTTLLSEAGDDQNAIRTVLGFLSESASSLADRAGDILNRFIESLAVMIVTSCLIPLLVLAFCVWMINQIIGVNISVRFPRRRSLFRRRLTTAIGHGPAEDDDSGQD